MTSKYNKLRNKRVLVLGATSGIGFCVAEGALEHGAIVIISGSDQGRIDSTIQRLLKDYPDAQDRLSGCACDLASIDDAESNVVALLDFATNHGQDKLHHIAKTSGDNISPRPLQDVTSADFQKMQQVRTFSSIIIAKYIPKYMHVASTSSYTMTSGVNVAKPSPGWCLLAASLSSTEGLTRGLAVDMKPVRVNCVAPGAILTELWEKVFGDDPDARNRLVDSYTQKQLVPGLGRPEDTAEAYLYFMKDGFVDGQVLLTDGGSILGA